jgi:hypothetical protein
MKRIPLVTKEQAHIARHIERKLLNTPMSSGILFVGVRVEPVIGDSHPNDSAYDIWVGCSRDMDEDLISKAVYLVLSAELSEGVYIRDVEVHRGFIRCDGG